MIYIFIACNKMIHKQEEILAWILLEILEMSIISTGPSDIGPPLEPAAAHGPPAPQPVGAVEDGAPGGDGQGQPQHHQDPRRQGGRVQGGGGAAVPAGGGGEGKHLTQEYSWLSAHPTEQQATMSSVSPGPGQEVGQVAMAVSVAMDPLILDTCLWLRDRPAQPLAPQASPPSQPGEMEAGQLMGAPPPNTNHPRPVLGKLEPS